MGFQTLSVYDDPSDCRSSLGPITHTLIYPTVDFKCMTMTLEPRVILSPSGSAS